jgi:hypothetical protein
LAIYEYILKEIDWKSGRMGCSEAEKASFMLKYSYAPFGCSSQFNVVRVRVKVSIEISRKFGCYPKSHGNILFKADFGVFDYSESIGMPRIVSKSTDWSEPEFDDFACPQL